MKMLLLLVTVAMIAFSVIADRKNFGPLLNGFFCGCMFSLCVSVFLWEKLK